MDRRIVIAAAVVTAGLAASPARAQHVSPQELAEALEAAEAALRAAWPTLPEGESRALARYGLRALRALAAATPTTQPDPMGKLASIEAQDARVFTAVEGVVALFPGLVLQQIDAWRPVDGQAGAEPDHGPGGLDYLCSCLEVFMSGSAIGGSSGKRPWRGRSLDAVLESLVAHATPEVRGAALRKLYWRAFQVPPTASVPEAELATRQALVGAAAVGRLGDPDARVRRQAVDGLLRLGPRTLGLFRAAWRRDDTRVRPVIDALFAGAREDRLWATRFVYSLVGKSIVPPEPSGCDQSPEAAAPARRAAEGGWIAEAQALWQRWRTLPASEIGPPAPAPAPPAKGGG